VRVRQALNYAIDRKTIAAALVGKYGHATSEVETPDGFDPKFVNYYPYNPAKARSLLAAAGYPNGFTIDTPVPAIGSGYNITGGAVTQAVAKYFAAVGVKITVKAEDIGSWVRDVIVAPAPMFMWPMGIVPMWEIYTVVAKPGANGNKLGGGWKDPTLFNLWVKGSRAANPTPYWQQMTARLVTQADYIPVYTIDNLEYVNAKKVQGVVGTRIGLSLASGWAPK
jgi:peptide/nickel transport system substrate-binding protein